ncbi:MAG: bifunctional transaldolase/phosoglucose isomerase, partial [Actinomycetota bacterium]
KRLRRIEGQVRGLQRLIDEDSLAGVTSNPSIFSKAIGGSTDYDSRIKELAEAGDPAPIDVFYDVALEDIGKAADLFRPAYDASGGRDGFVSFELEPKLAHDTDGSIAKARELFATLGRPNVLIKVPGTAEGVPAIEELTASGVNVNVTLLFSVARYEEVALAYVRGLERRLKAGEPIDRLASVASFFVSRVDTAVDGQLPDSSPLRGKIAVANAKLAYRRFREIFSGPRWEPLAAAGAGVQRPLWASTGTKNHAYSDVLYVEELVGADTVNTMPQATMDAFREHGQVRPGAVEEAVDQAQSMVTSLAGLGIDLAAITAKLEVDGIDAFTKDLRTLLGAIAEKIEHVREGRGRWTASLGDLVEPVERRLAAMAEGNVVSRMWRRDYTVWKPDPTEIENRLGWLSVPALMAERVTDLQAFAKQAVADGFTQAVHMGMGGSSLAPEVLRRTFGVAQGAIDLQVLDSTHPATIAAVEASLDLDHTLFIVASKSGGTLETMSHFHYFYDKVRSGDHFVAITDPGTSLEALAKERGFRATFINPDDIGGRYSALSLFGLVPAALIGADLSALLDAGEDMAHACDGCVPCGENPGAWLGAVMGEAALAGRDKFTVALAPGFETYGDWIEQLIAESTGKEGKGIVPVTGEDLADPGSYGSDRLFVALGDVGGDVGDAQLDALAGAGHPVVRIPIRQPADLGAEFFRAEFATAIAGSILGINAFDQPNVAEAKHATAEILEAGPVPDPGSDDLGALLAQVKPGDYIAIQAYLDRSPEAEEMLHRARLALRDRYQVATTVGFGPRFLHSTGQLHKGGPNTGVFIQIVDRDRSVDLPIPGAAYTFGTLIDAQSLGDLRSLRGRDRRVARITLDQLTAATG